MSPLWNRRNRGPVRHHGGGTPQRAQPGGERGLIADQVGDVVEVGGGVDDVLGHRPAERGQPAQIKPGPQDAVRLGQSRIGAGVAAGTGAWIGAGVGGRHVTICTA